MCSRETQEASVGGGAEGDVQDQRRYEQGGRDGLGGCHVGLLIFCWVWVLLRVYNMVSGLLKACHWWLSRKLLLFSYLPYFLVFLGSCSLQEVELQELQTSLLTRRRMHFFPFITLFSFLWGVCTCVLWKRDTERERERSYATALWGRGRNSMWEYLISFIYTYSYSAHLWY